MYVLFALLGTLSFSQVIQLHNGRIASVDSNTMTIFDSSGVVQHQATLPEGLNVTTIAEYPGVGISLLASTLVGRQVILKYDLELGSLGLTDVSLPPGEARSMFVSPSGSIKIVVEKDGFAQLVTIENGARIGAPISFPRPVNQVLRMWGDFDGLHIVFTYDTSGVAQVKVVDAKLSLEFDSSRTAKRGRVVSLHRVETGAWVITKLSPHTLSMQVLPSKAQPKFRAFALDLPTEALVGGPEVLFSDKGTTLFYLDGENESAKVYFVNSRKPEEKIIKQLHPVKPQIPANSVGDCESVFVF